MLRQTRAGYVGNDLSVQASLPGVPDIAFADGTVGFGSYNGYPQFFHENIYNYVDLVSVSHGKHSLKGGAEIRRNIENSDWNAGRPPYYLSSSTSCSSPLISPMTRAPVSIPVL
jgi:hypothetical protein